MIDPNFIRQNPERMKAIIEKGRGNPQRADVEMWLELDSKRSNLIQMRDKILNERNELSQGHTGKPDQTVIDKVKKLKSEVETLESELSDLEIRWQEILDWMPNIPLDDVVDGKGEEDNIEIKAWDPKQGYFDDAKLEAANGSAKYMSEFASHGDTDFKPLPHWEIGEKLGIINLEAGSKTSGSRFYYLVGDGVLLVEAIFQLLWQKLIEEGFTPLYVPLLVREKALYGSSHFPGDADQVYKLDNGQTEDQNSLYLIGSSEPSNFAMFAGKTFTEDELPVKVMARSTCFRSEAGSWGKDVRGIKRMHQFEKLEMNIITNNDLESNRKMHDYLLSLNEWLLQQLLLPYHVINMCLGDLGYYAAAKKYDIEFWTPSLGTYTELMSDSITTDYQARRLGIRYKDKSGNSNYAYTLNDTGVTHRVLIAILEHYQQSDGSIKVPDVLVKYMGKEMIGKVAN